MALHLAQKNLFQLPHWVKYLGKKYFGHQTFSKLKSKLNILFALLMAKLQNYTILTGKNWGGTLTTLGFSHMSSF